MRSRDDPIHRVSREQAGIVTYAQAKAVGLTHSSVRARVDSGRWRRLHRGVFATFTGPLPRISEMWAALLVTGRGAMVSHASAAELWHLTDTPAPTIHVTIPASRRITPVRGVSVHLSSRADRIRHPTRKPPRTTIEETVLDLVTVAGSRDDAIAIMSAAIGRRLTTVARLATALRDRPRFRWRNDIVAALTDMEPGALSVLEVRYLRRVERAHGLPCGTRQSPATQAGRRIYRDIRYADFGTVVELDGRAFHPPERRQSDAERDNVAAAAGDLVLHYGWDAVTVTPCATATNVAGVLRRNGWTGSLRPCGPGCMIAKSRGRGNSRDSSRS